MSLGSFVDYVEMNGLLRPAVIVHRHRNAVAVPMDLAYLFTGNNPEHDQIAMKKAIDYCAVLFDGHVTKADTIKILDLISQNMNAAVFAPPAPKDMEFDMQKATEKMGLILNVNGEEVVNYA